MGLLTKKFKVKNLVGGQTLKKIKNYDLSM